MPSPLYSLLGAVMLMIPVYGILASATHTVLYIAKYFAR
jgi:hypothetical protein